MYGESPLSTDPSLYAALVEALPDPILVVTGSERSDLTGRRFIFANTAARELLRIIADAGMLLSAVRDPAVLSVVDKALFDGADADGFYETTASQSRSLRVRARPLGLGADGTRLALLTFHDETEVRRVEKTRVDFLANASHELRTPLASLSGFIETLRGHAKDDPAAREKFLGIMQAQADRMARLIADLTSLSRIELDEHVPPRGVVDLVLLVGEVVEAAAPLGAQRGVKLDWRPCAACPVAVRGERDQIVQVVQNLLDNAIKYSPDGAAVRIELRSGLSELAAAASAEGVPRLSLVAPDPSSESYASLRVTDLGPGIARQNLPRLSERFYRVDGQKSGARSGTGLGLAIVKHIMNRHRGGLVVSSAEGEGSTFTAYFPMAGAPEAVVKAS
ncbi:ATP-binding protein [Phenylobacterium sp.]|uniref:ATP-binding protein n=1 Tax=Phenylobacterium sp. TaxID=1871053 RepID=UPI00374D85C9